MNVYGVDYLDPSDDTIKYLVVDACSMDEARIKAQNILKSNNIPKKNILLMEELVWLKY